MTLLDSYSFLLAASWWSEPSNLISAAKAAMGLGFVIFVHELGHFLVAKACGVKCEKFYIGFDVPLQLGPIKFPAALFKKQWGETEYGVGVIPLGGYVKMLGQDDNPANQEKENDRIRAESGGELDPRSYPAKSVPQRMAIISAGVIMNLIFAVIFATVAYKMGVNYTPCDIGATMPGDPAWQMNLQAGDKLVQLGRDGERNEHLRFRYDLRFFVIEVGEGKDCDFLVRHSDGTEEWITVQPSIRKNESGLPTIGVTSAYSNRIDKPRFELDSPFEQTDLAVGDRITAMTFDGERFKVNNGADVRRLLTQHADTTAVLEVVNSPEEKANDDTPVVETTRTVSLRTRRLRSVGITPAMGKIIAIQNGSPAALAGIQAGDALTGINGEPIGNPMTLDQRLLENLGETVTLNIKRKSGEETQVDVTPRAPIVPGAVLFPAGPSSLETLGIAYEATRKVAAVVEGSAAAEAGLQPGDVLTEAQFVVPEDDTKATDLLSVTGLGKPLDLVKDDASWAWVASRMQEMPATASVDVKFQRGDETKSASLTPTDDPTYFNHDRGITLKGSTGTRTASSMSAALSLGVRETKEGIMQVILTLKKIKKLFTKLGGPGTIAVAATSEASEGWPRLFIFLTLLSANLAVLNFLPIPVLDGGHMLFLAYEGLMGKPVNERIAFGLTMLGLSFILGLMVFVIGMDVYRFGFSG